MHTLPTFLTTCFAGRSPLFRVSADIIGNLCTVKIHGPAANKHQLYLYTKEVVYAVVFAVHDRVNKNNNGVL